MGLILLDLLLDLFQAGGGGGLWELRPCIPNLNSNFRVGFRVGTSFSRYPKFKFNVIFLMFSENSV